MQMDSSSSAIPHPNALSGSIALINDKETFPNFMQNTVTSSSLQAQNIGSIPHQNAGLEEVDSSIDDTESLDSNCSIKKVKFGKCLSIIAINGSNVVQLYDFWCGTLLNISHP